MFRNVLNLKPNISLLSQFTSRQKSNSRIKPPTQPEWRVKNWVNLPRPPKTQHDRLQAKKSNDPSRATYPANFRFIYPEFLPDPTVEFRNPIREKLERMDMLKRRANVDIPEFYPGTIMAVTRSNEHAPDKSSRFLGICVERLGAGMRSEFTLRNCINGLGVEIRFFLYDPTIQKIEVIRLEKRLEQDLRYLRDAYPEYSTFPLDMEPEVLPEGSPVPINTTKVKLKPRPWGKRWERFGFKGVDQEVLDSYLSEKMKMQRELRKKPWEKYDLMKQYRRTIPEEEQIEIFAEVASELHKQELSRKKLKKKKEFIKPKKAG